MSLADVQTAERLARQALEAWNAAPNNVAAMHAYARKVVAYGQEIGSDDILVMGARMLGCKTVNEWVERMNADATKEQDVAASTA